MFGENYPRGREDPSACIHHQSHKLRKLQNIVLHPRTVLLLRTNEPPEGRLNCRPLVDALFLRDLANVGRLIFPLHVRRARLHRLVVVLGVNLIRERWPLLPELDRLFLNACVFKPLTLWIPLKVEGCSTI